MLEGWGWWTIYEVEWENWWRRRIVFAIIIGKWLCGGWVV